MKKCEKCGQPLNESGICDNCQETVDTEAKKKKSKFTAAKERFIKDGKNAVIGFIIRRVVSLVLSALLGAGIVFFAQFTLRDDFEDYYYDELKYMMTDFMAVYEYVHRAQDMDFDELRVYYEEHHIHEKAKDLLKKATAYSSDVEEINMVHTQYVDACNALIDLSSLVYVSSTMEEDLSVQFAAEMKSLTVKIEIFNETTDKLCEKYDI